jgi:hypothetical protein
MFIYKEHSWSFTIFMSREYVLNDVTTNLYGLRFLSLDDE